MMMSSCKPQQGPPNLCSCREWERYECRRNADYLPGGIEGDRWVRHGSIHAIPVASGGNKLRPKMIAVCEECAPYHALQTLSHRMSSLRRTVSKNDTYGGLAVVVRSNHETQSDRVDGIVSVFSPESYRQRHGDEPDPPSFVRPHRSSAAQTLSSSSSTVTGAP